MQVSSRQPRPAGPDRTQRAGRVAQQASAPTAAPSEASRRIATDLYALLLYLHKDCTADLFEALGALDLTISQTKLLQKLEHADRELTLKHVAEMLALSLPAASRAVDDLVRRGMVVRHEDVEDRRMKRVHLTEKGRATSRRLNAARLNGLEQFAASLTNDERRALVAALTRLLRRPEIAVCRPEGSPTP